MGASTKAMGVLDLPTAGELDDVVMGDISDPLDEVLGPDAADVAEAKAKEAPEQEASEQEALGQEAPKQEAPAAPSPEHARLAEIKAVRDRLREYETDYLRAKREAKAAKELYESEVEALKSIIDKQLESYPLFDGPAPVATTSPESPAASPPPPADDDWRNVGIEQLGLHPNMTEKLCDAGVTTIGAFEDLRGGEGLMTIPGVGRTKADQLENAALDWLSKHRDADALSEAGGEAADEADKADDFQPIPWQKTSVEDLGLSKAIVNALRDEEFYSMADLHRWIETGNDFGAIPGVTELRANKIWFAYDQCIHGDREEPAKSTEPTEPDSWKKTPVTEMGFPEELVKLLHNCGLRKAVDLERWRTSQPGEFGAIPGINEEWAMQVWFANDRIANQ